MSSTNPDSKPANLITALRLRSGQAWAQRDWCWIVVFTAFLQRILNPDFPNWIALISTKCIILTVNVLH